MFYKLIIAVVLALLLLGKANAQENSNDSIPEEIKSKIQEKVEHDILWYRAALCPEVDFERFVTRGYANNIIIARRDPKEIFLSDSLGYHWQDYKMIMDITRWPKDNPKQNSYLLEKQGLEFTNGIDTVSYDICNDYFDYNENYVVYYKKGGIPQVISGNAFHTISYPFVNISKKLNVVDALRLAYFKLGRFNGSQVHMFPNQDLCETQEYYQFHASKSSLSPKSVLVRVPKSDPFNTIELLYYTNDTTVTKEDIYGLYEVKYTIKSKPETYEEILPVITKMDRQFINEKIKNESKKWGDVAYFIEMPPIIQQETVTIEGKIDSVYIGGDPIIFVVDTNGKKTEIPYEVSTNYLIKGKGKRQVVVKESGEIIYKED